ncbi:MAG: FAD-dependent oxidoreductase [Oscillospiraceae bacterium]
MKEFFAGQFDIAVIGAGHAGIEAALAAARMGLETASP